MSCMVTLKDYQMARNRRTAAEEWEARMVREGRKLMLLAAGLGVLFVAMALRGFGLL